MDRAAGGRDGAGATLGRERVTLTETEAASVAAAEAAAAAERALADAADGFGLAAQLGRLPELRDAAAAYRDGLKDFVRTLRDRYEAADDLAAAEAARERVAEAERRAGADADTAGREAEAAAATHATLEETSGQGVREVEARFAAARGELVGVKRESEAAQASVEDLKGTSATARAKREREEERRAASDAARDEQVAELQAFEREGFLAVCASDADTGADADPVLGSLPDDPAAPWSATRGVEVARRVDDAYAEPHDDEAIRRVTKSLHEAFHDLNEGLARRNDQAMLDPVLQTRAYAARIRLAGEERPVHVVVGELADEIRQREETLSAEEREVIENHLIGEAAEALVGCIHAAKQLVADMSAELSGKSTATGMQLRFRWTLDADDPALESTRSAMDLLKGSVLRLRPADRVALGNFLQARIKSVREAEPGVPWLACLTTALDYRAWHRFAVEKRANPAEPWRAITRRTFGTGSGGEKALMLTLPQFAAASAHYRSAPRRRGWCCSTRPSRASTRATAATA